MKEYEMAAHVTCMGEMRNSYKSLIGKPERKGPFTRPRHRWEVNIKMDSREMSLEVWIGFFWLRIWISGSV
jgi:hypothetical protein